MKLTKTQQGVIYLMQSGWELGTSIAGGGSGRSWLQKGGVGKGGESRTISSATVHALDRKGLIKSEYSFPTKKWRLIK